MNPLDIGAGVLLGLAFVLAGVVAVRAGRRSGLGITHPGLVWLAGHGVLFGFGSFALALGSGRPGPAAYLAAAVAAFAVGMALAERLARRSSSAARGSVPSELRAWVVAALAIASVLIVVPTLVTIGIPFLVGDITSARVELSGLIVQPLRVFLPAAAVVAVLEGRRYGRRRIGLAVAAVLGVAVFELLLASRYLLAELAAAIVLGWLLDGGRIPRRVGLAAAAAALAVFGGVQLLRAYDQAQGRELAFVVERTVNRVLFIQPRTIDALMTVIPAEQPHFGGATWLRRLGPILGSEPPPNLGYWIYPRVVGESGTGTTPSVAGYAAPGLLGEAWANLGWLGALLFVIVGFGAGRLGELVAAHRHSVANVVAGALATLFLARTHALGLNGVFVVLVLVAVWRLAVAPALDLPRAAIALVERRRSWR